MPGSFSLSNEIAVDRNGNVWFSERKDRRLVRFNPATEKFKRFDIPGRGVPEGITADKKGNIWYCDKKGGKLGRLNPSQGAFVEFDIALSNGQPFDIAVDSDGNVWFSETGTNNIGRLDIDYATAKSYDDPDLSVKLDAGQKKIFEKRNP